MVARDLLPVTFDEHGRVDVAELALAVQPDALTRGLAQWVAARLAGDDPYLGADPDSIQPSWTLFAGMWRRSHPDGVFRRALDLALADVLRTTPCGVEVADLLALIEQVQPPACWRQARERAAALLEPPRRELSDIDHAWLAAAAAYDEQCQADLIVAWEEALGDTDYQPEAWTAVSHNLYRAVVALPTLVRQWEPEWADTLLPLHLDPLLERDEEEVRSLLERYRARLAEPAWLWPAVQDWLPLAETDNGEENEDMGFTLSRMVLRDEELPVAA